MSSFALVDVSKFIPHFLRVLQQSIYFTEKMIHGFSALFESFTIPILAYFLKTEKGQSHEPISPTGPMPMTATLSPNWMSASSAPWKPVGTMSLIIQAAPRSIPSGRWARLGSGENDHGSVANRSGRQSQLWAGVVPAAVGKDGAVMTDAELARAIAEKAAEQGGTVYFVGGCVRDRLLGLENKDIDIEVHGIPAEALEQLLSELGACMKIGKSFGIYGLKGHALDIALPRTERRTGVGHRDFAVTSDPFLGTYEAAKRRDFTMNALMQNVLTGEIIDHFGGRQDLQDGVLRHVDDVTFTEDPLRVLRAAQFAARFQFSVAAETVELCRRIDLSALSRERVMLEMEKALLRAEKPSLFFGELRTMGQLGHWFPEVQALIGT